MPDSGARGIDKLDYHPGRPLLPPDSNESSARPGQDTSYAGSFFEHVAEGIADRDRDKMRTEVIRYFGFFWAIVNSLCVGSISTFSLYAPLFQRRLHYTQLRVNGISITAELALYLPVTLFGFICDRYGPRIPSLMSGVLFAFGYILAAFAYKSGPPASAGGDGWPYGVMVISFVAIGMATACGYIASVSTCAKNFGRGKHKGMALALPIACFGLSGMWQSAVGSQLLYEPRPDGKKGDVDVYRFFLFLGCTLGIAGIVGSFVLRIVDEEELIDEAVEELERSGLLEDSLLFHQVRQESGYGTINDQDLSAEQEDEIYREVQERKRRADEEQRKKTWLLNEETRRFLYDRSMWLLAAGFFFVTGPGEAFINNLGTIIGTFYPPYMPEDDYPTSAAVHVSIIAITSTIARIVTGTVTDLVAPTAVPHQHRRGPNSTVSSLVSLPPNPYPERKRFEVSRMVFLLGFAIILSIGQVLLASGLMQQHGERFWIVSSCIGAGYGAVFSLVPIIISVVWGVENFATNWGIVATFPALGATVWGLIYSWVYQAGAAREATWTIFTTALSKRDVVEDVLCYGQFCYAPTFWAMAVSVWLACLSWYFAWRGPGGWFSRGVVV